MVIESLALAYAPTDAQLTAVQDMTVYGRMGAHLRVLRRCSAKGVPLLLGADGWLRTDEHSPEVARVKAYDARNNAAGKENLFAGTVATNHLADPDVLGDPGIWFGADISEDPVAPPAFQIGRRQWRLPLLLAGLEWHTQELPELLLLSRCLLVRLLERVRTHSVPDGRERVRLRHAGGVPRARLVPGEDRGVLGRLRSGVPDPGRAAGRDGRQPVPAGGAAGVGLPDVAWA